MAQATRGESNEIVVFSIVRDSVCAECGRELWKGSFLRMEHDRPLCLSCADLDHLWFLPSGDTALTRRASKYSGLRAVVVRFSRARGRYERQGVLVEQAALERAEQECLDDAEHRRVRERAAERRLAWRSPDASPSCTKAARPPKRWPLRATRAPSEAGASAARARRSSWTRRP